MRFKFKYAILLVVLGSLGGIVYGFAIMDKDAVLANKCIGFGTVGLFLVAMPMFLIKESKGKKVKDYMLTEENIRNMRERTSKKSENQ